MGFQVSIFKVIMVFSSGGHFRSDHRWLNIIETYPSSKMHPILDGRNFRSIRRRNTTIHCPFSPASSKPLCLLVTATKTLPKVGSYGAPPSRCLRLEALLPYSEGLTDRKKKGNDAAAGTTTKDLMAATLRASSYLGVAPFVPALSLSA